MPVKRKFTFPMSTLLYQADLILTAAEDQPAFVTKRLSTELMSQARTILEGLGGAGSSAQAQQTKTGHLTKVQNDHITEMLDLFGKLKDSAKRAFPGEQVKLRESFQVGINEPADLASILGRAKKGRDAALDAANAAALRAKGGWIGDDTTALSTAIGNAGLLDKQQQASVIVQIAGTDARNTAANTLYDNLLTIQNAADIEWPARQETNRAVRESFRMPGFPPPDKGDDGEESNTGGGASPTVTP